MEEENKASRNTALFGKSQKDGEFVEGHEHSVIPSLDYPFAKEFYEPSDSRYKLIKIFENQIWETKKMKNLKRHRGDE